MGLIKEENIISHLQIIIIFILDGKILKTRKLFLSHVCHNEKNERGFEVKYHNLPRPFIHFSVLCMKIQPGERFLKTGYVLM